MIYLNKMHIYVPSRLKPVKALQQETGLSTETLNIYQKIYGLNTIHLAEGETQMSMLDQAIKPLCETINLKHFQYFIHAHTSALLVAEDKENITTLLGSLSLSSEIIFGMTQYKCLSLFKALLLLNNLMNSPLPQHALVVAGEIAYTPSLRVVPQTALVSDMACAVHITNIGEQHQLIGGLLQLIKGYAQGIYLTAGQLHAFESHYMNNMQRVISQALQKANLKLENIACILPHNVSLLAWRKIAKALGYPFDKIYTKNIARYGHGFSVDHILNLQHAIADGYIKPGDYYLMFGCAIGFYMGCLIFKY